MKKKRPDEPLPTTARLQNLRLDVLVPHPEQKKYFRNYGTYEYSALKADIKANGLLHPIMVLPPKNAAGLPPYTILVGHTRRKILIEIGEVTTGVQVRYDLVNATRAEVDKIFLNDNVARRQQDRLGQARAAVRLFQIERELKGRSVVGDPFQYGELRDRVGLIVGMSGRNLARYLNVLSAPIEVQDAFESKKVKLVDAAKVSSLPKDDQKRLAERLRAGENAGAVFAEFFAPRDGKHVKTADAVASLARSLERAGADFSDRLDTVKPGPVLRNEEALRAGVKLLRALLGRIDAPEGGRGGAARAAGDR